MGKCPLWMPEGSVRGIIAGVIIGTFCYLAARSFAIPDKLSELAFLIVGTYFATRAGAGSPPPPPLPAAPPLPVAPPDSAPPPGTTVPAAP